MDRPIVIRNEFACVHVEVVEYRSGSALKITVADSGVSSIVDPLELEGIAGMNHREFDQFVVRTRQASADFEAHDFR